MRLKFIRLCVVAIAIGLLMFPLSAAEKRAVTADVLLQQQSGISALFAMHSFDAEWIGNSHDIVVPVLQGTGQWPIIAKVNADTGAIATLAEGSHPQVSPDGKTIAFSRGTIDSSGRQIDQQAWAVTT